MKMLRYKWTKSREREDCAGLSSYGLFVFEIQEAKGK